MDHPAWLACTGGGLLLDQGCRITPVFLDIAKTTKVLSTVPSLCILIISDQRQVDVECLEHDVHGERLRDLSTCVFDERELEVDSHHHALP